MVFVSQWIEMIDAVSRIFNKDRVYHNIIASVITLQDWKNRIVAIHGPYFYEDHN